MLLVFSLFLVDTKKIYGYNVVAPLRLLLRGETHFLRSEFGKKKIGLLLSPTIITKLINSNSWILWISLWKYISGCQGFIIKPCNHYFEMTLTISLSDDSFSGYVLVMYLNCYSKLFNYPTPMFYFYAPWKSQKTSCFDDIFRVCRYGILVWNGLMRKNFPSENTCNSSK